MHSLSPKRFLNLNEPDDLIEALARVVRLAQEDYQTDHCTSQPGGQIFKQSDRSIHKIAVLIGVQHYREGHYPALLNTYRTALWSAHVNAEDKQDERRAQPSSS